MESNELLKALVRRYDRFIERVRHGDASAAAEEFARACYLTRRGELKLSNRALAGFAEVWIDLFWQCRNHEMMLKVAEDAEANFGKEPEWAFARGESLFYMCRFDEAQEALAPLTTEDFEEPMLYYLLGCLAERRGSDDDARRLFQTANRLEPKEFALPTPISENEALEIYRECLNDMPLAITSNLGDVPIFVDALPSNELLHSVDPPFEPLVMGLFLGQPLGTEESPWASDQPRILLFHKNIAKVAGDLEMLEEELRKTLFHEVGHFLGFDEDQLEEMGLA